MPERDFSHDEHARSSPDLCDLTDEQRAALAEFYADADPDLFPLFPDYKDADPAAIEERAAAFRALGGES